MKWRVKFKLFQLSTYGIVFSAIILVSALTGKYIEAIAFFVAFVSLRYAFPKTYHSSSFWKCIFISVKVIAFAILFTPNKNISILASILFGLIVDFTAYKYKDYLDLMQVVNKPFSIHNCTESELVARCKALNYNELKTQMAVKFFVQKQKPKQVWQWLCETQENPLQWDSVIQIKYLMKKDLF